MLAHLEHSQVQERQRREGSCQYRDKLAPGGLQICIHTAIFCETDHMQRVPKASWLDLHVSSSGVSQPRCR